MNIHDYWAFKGKYTMRPVQEKILNEITDALKKGYTNIILEAGTGIGKSAIAVTLANMMGTSYILTMTTQLQQQYINDFHNIPGLAQVKGRRHYDCIMNNYSCDEGMCQTQEDFDCFSEADCNYLTARTEAIDSRICLTNYDYLYYVGN